MLAEPAVPAATVLGVLAMAAAVVSDPLAELCARLAGLPCRWLVLVARESAKIPGATVGWPAGPVGALGMASACCVGIAFLRRRRPRRALAALLAGLVAVRLAGHGR
jgi:competence protein ComEC